MKILFLHRAKVNGRFSFEELFSTIQKHLKDVDITDFYDKTYSGFFKNISAIKKINTDVIHITGGIGYYALFLPTNKTILTVHDTNHYEYDLKGIKKWLHGWIIYRLPIKNVKYVTVVSEHTKKNLVRFFKIKEEKIKVIPNCYPSEFKATSSSNFIEPIKILQIGTKLNKNIPRLIEAIKDLNIELTIVGEINTPLKNLLKENKIAYINKVNLTRLEIYQEYINTDMVAFISLQEGFGLPIIEANAVGRPVISSNTSSMPEVANNAAHLVDPKNIDEIKNGFIKIITNVNYRNLLIENGTKNAKRFHPDIIAMNYRTIYEEINGK